jgi:hypothetical protein
MPGQFIQRLPGASGGLVDVRVREADYRHAAACDRDVPGSPSSAPPTRIDAEWSWATLYLRRPVL